MLLISLDLCRERLRPLDVLGLRGLYAAGEQHDDLATTAGEVDSPAGAAVDTQFHHTAADRLRVAHQACLQALDPRHDDALGRHVGKAVEPGAEGGEVLIVYTPRL